MYCLSQFCFLCLNRENNLRSINSFDNDNKSIQEKLIYTINDIVFLDPSYETKICKFCYDILRVTYEFKRKCLENNNVIIGYVKKLTEYSTKYGNANVVLQPFPEKSIDLTLTNEETTVKVDTITLKQLLADSKFKVDMRKQTIPWTKNNITSNTINESQKNYLKANYKRKPGPNCYHLKQYNSHKVKSDTSPKKIAQIKKCFAEQKISKFEANNKTPSKLDIVVKVEPPGPTSKIEKNTILDTNISKSAMSPTKTNLLEGKLLIKKEITEHTKEIGEPSQNISKPKDDLIKNHSDGLNFVKIFLNENNNLKTQPENIDTDTDTSSSYFVEHLNESSGSSFDFIEENIFSEEERKSYETIRDNIYKNIETKPEVIEIRDSPKKTAPAKTEDYITSVLLNLSKTPQKTQEKVVKETDIISQPNTEPKTNKRLIIKRKLQKISRKFIEKAKPNLKIDRTYLNKNKPNPVQTEIDSEDEFGTKLESLLSELKKPQASPSNVCEDPQIVVNLIPEMKIPKSAISLHEIPCETNFPSVKNYTTPVCDPYSDPVFVLKLDHCYTMQPNYKSLGLKRRIGNKGRKRRMKAVPAKRRKHNLESTVQKNIKKSYRFRCFICYMKVPSQSDLDEHLINEHQGHHFNNCNFCSKKFTTYFSLKRHCRNVHRMSISMEEHFDYNQQSKYITSTTNNTQE